MKVASIQLNVREDKEKNIQKALKFVDQAAKEGAKLVCLPEYIDYMGPDDKELKQKMSETIPGSTTNLFSEKAKALGIYINCGSFMEKADDGRSYNTSVLFNDKGEIIATYRKMHLYDVEMEDRISIKESDAIKPGSELSVVDTPVGKMGLSICYDVRFPELYRSLALQGAQIMFIPAAFPIYTGYLHWELLIRARAVENQCYVIATGQYGFYDTGEGVEDAKYGSSMIVDPWGTVIARAPEGEGIITADIDITKVDEFRNTIPCFKHRKPEYYQL